MMSIPLDSGEAKRFCRDGGKKEEKERRIDVKGETSLKPRTTDVQPGHSYIRMYIYVVQTYNMCSSWSVGSVAYLMGVALLSTRCLSSSEVLKVSKWCTSILFYCVCMPT